MKNKKGQKSVLFVDIDGVLINGNYIEITMDFHKANPLCVDQLNRVTAATGAQIVLSSAWRVLGLTHMQEQFRKWNVRAPIIDITPDFGALGKRGLEIQRWLDLHPDVKRFAIVDDNSWMDHLSPYLVLTNFDRGLTPQKADELIQLLKRGPRNGVHSLSLN